MQKSYSSFKEIRHDLKKLQLQREIAYEEIVNHKHMIENEISSLNWIVTAFNIFKKFGAFLVVKKIFK